MGFFDDNQIFWTRVLSTAIINRGNEESATYVSAALTRQNLRTRYILAILRSTPELRDEVRAQMGANVTANPLDDSSMQILYILTAYEMMEEEKKVQFQLAFKACGTLQSQGSWEITEQNTHQPGHVPPINEP